MDFSIMLYIGTVLWRKPDDIENRVSASLKRVENEAVTLKYLAFKIFIFILCKIRHFCQIFKKSCVIIFIDILSLRYQWYTVTFSFLAHLSRRLTGELIGYPWIRRPSVRRRPSSSVVRPSVHIFKRLLL